MMVYHYDRLYESTNAILSPKKEAEVPVTPASLFAFSAISVYEVFGKEDSVGVFGWLAGLGLSEFIFSSTPDERIVPVLFTTGFPIGSLDSKDCSRANSVAASAFFLYSSD